MAENNELQLDSTVLEAGMVNKSYDTGVIILKTQESQIPSRLLIIWYS